MRMLGKQIRRTVVTVMIALLLALAAGVAMPEGAASAYDSAPAPVATDTAADAPAQQRRGEAELPWLFAVYAITWAAFFGYVFMMSRRQREMQREIDILKRALDAKMDDDTDAR